MKAIRGGVRVESVGRRPSPRNSSGNAASRAGEVGVDGDDGDERGWPRRAERRQGAGHGQVGDGRPLPARTAQRQPTGATGLGQYVSEQGRLADPGVSSQQDDPRLSGPGLVQPGLGRVHFPVPADEGAARATVRPSRVWPPGSASPGYPAPTSPGLTRLGPTGLAGGADGGTAAGGRKGRRRSRSMPYTRRLASSSGTCSSPSGRSSSRSYSGDYLRRRQAVPSFVVPEIAVRASQASSHLAKGDPLLLPGLPQTQPERASGNTGSANSASPVCGVTCIVINSCWWRRESGITRPPPRTELTEKRAPRRGLRGPESRTPIGELAALTEVVEAPLAGGTDAADGHREADGELLVAELGMVQHGLDQVAPRGARVDTACRTARRRSASRAEITGSSSVTAAGSASSTSMVGSRLFLRRRHSLLVTTTSQPPSASGWRNRRMCCSSLIHTACWTSLTSVAAQPDDEAIARDHSVVAPVQFLPGLLVSVCGPADNLAARNVSPTAFCELHCLASSVARWTHHQGAEGWSVPRPNTASHGDLPSPQPVPIYRDSLTTIRK